MPTKLPIDWQLVRMKYEAGQTAYRISQDMGGRPTKQGITLRPNKEGWNKGAGSAITIANELPIVKQALALAGPTKCTAERVAFVLDLVSRGSSERLTATAAGISAKTLARWKQQDPVLTEQLRQARAGKLAEWIGRIDEAATRDWKAADRLLQASPDLDDWSQTQQGGITIVLNIDRDQQGVVIEGTSKEVS